MDTAVGTTGQNPPGTRRHLTYEDLRAEMPESNQPCELWDGELIIAPAPFFKHQKIALRLYRKLDDWVSAHQLGEVIAAPIDMVLSPHRVVQPDVAYIALENLHLIRDVIYGAADLVGEVISPGSRQRDRIEKKDLYEQYGVREYWIIDPEAQTLELYHLSPGQQYELLTRCRPGQSARSRLLPGFEIAADYLFTLNPAVARTEGNEDNEG